MALLPLALKLAVGLAAIAMVLILGTMDASPVRSSAAAQALADDDVATGHEADEGPLLSGDGGQETVSSGVRCDPDAPQRHYSVVAVDVDITLNRYLDHDPLGRMYVLESDLSRVRQEEAQNRAARAGQGEPAVTVGEQGDAIQPLTLRVNQGECLRINLRNDLADGGSASIHLHGSGLRIAGIGTPAIATNRAAMAGPGETVQYEWMVESDEPEGTHYFHSHGDARDQTNHGLFGAVIVEPNGATVLDPLTGGELRSGWQAMIRVPGGSSFREIAIYYHEIGDERYRHLDRDDRLVVQVDPFTSSYRPGDRALNYRSEPFMNRLALQQQMLGTFDKSAAYSSYVFGDPATPIPRSYLGDPMRQRVIHGGSEVFHVHHVHGGAIRWRRQPNVESAAPDSGLDKHPPLVPRASERVDSQSIGPSETYDIQDECGSGGCQQAAGDYMFHCHVAHHYLSGMWGIWRVYNTLQGAAASGDVMPALAELPDRAGRLAAAVTSDALIDRTVDWKGQSFHVDAASLPTWVERQLPPAGVPRGYDASVLDWIKDGSRYLNEVETVANWPGYRSAAPATRPPLTFDPLTGKLAYPFLRPHLGRRPPFAPNHGPAPFLEPIQQGTDTPAPGENGPWSLCPSGTRLKPYSIMAIAVPVPLNAADGVVDPSGSIYVLKDREDATRSTDALKVPLAIRTNAGEDCVDVLLRSKLDDGRDNSFLSKVDLHVHFVQFDVQASDGVDTGFNYEQSVRPCDRRCIVGPSGQRRPLPGRRAGRGRHGSGRDVRGAADSGGEQRDPDLRGAAEVFPCPR
ncbi:MAG: multicopper oxidase domain-containing protein [Chloroflexi bacterium]|nr:multicopper oxidase domain-containing protein [Chloroflexota bacterium]